VIPENVDVLNHARPATKQRGNATQAEGCDYGGANGATRAWVPVAER
jgi:hypothetical protein